jgi:hypothetical protein
MAGEPRHKKPVWGKKTEEFLVKVSRESVEQNTSEERPTILYFQVDYDKSKRNFYGEFEEMIFKNDKGTQVRGIITVSDTEVEEIARMVDQDTPLKFSVYFDHLKEIGIDPQIGDYFGYKHKFYYIYSKTALDASKSVIASGRNAIYISYSCYQQDDERIYIEPWRTESDTGTEENIK